MMMCPSAESAATLAVPPSAPEPAAAPATPPLEPVAADPAAADPAAADTEAALALVALCNGAAAVPKLTRSKPTISKNSKSALYNTYRLMSDNAITAVVAAAPALLGHHKFMCTAIISRGLRFYINTITSVRGKPPTLPELYRPIIKQPSRIVFISGRVMCETKHNANGSVTAVVQTTRACALNLQNIEFLVAGATVPSTGGQCWVYQRFGPDMAQFKHVPTIAECKTILQNEDKCILEFVRRGGQTSIVPRVFVHVDRKAKQAYVLKQYLHTSTDETDMVMFLHMRLTTPALLTTSF